ncbi:replicase [Physalis mottle virus]|uniref:Non-structural replication polyprotein n=1 Tax=Physalis mottle virus TaxID=72539 RepID=O91260_PHMV|nr:replicase [Physalis mottle virus]CAA76071.1 replicase protein [Physalis mottle virus]
MSYQAALDALNSTSHRDASTNPILNSVVEPLRDSLSSYPYLIPKEDIPLILSFGIPVSGLGTDPHPHPIHKTIEIHLLFTHWRHLARLPSTVMFMKPSKFRKLQAINPNFSHLLNYRLTSADTCRYPETSTHLPTTTSCFMHDALMYYHPSQILDLFMSCEQLQTLYCSLIVPPESHFTNLSLYPSVYTYQIHGRTLHYIPESHHAGSYDQPLDALSWLKIHSIPHPSLTLSVTRLESWGPCHSLLIQRGLPPRPSLSTRPPPLPNNPIRPLTPSHLNRVSAKLACLQVTLRSPPLSYLSFMIPDCLELPQATFLRQPLRHRLIPLSVYNSLFTYTRAVRTLRTSDPAGFVRTQSNKPEHKWVTPKAWDNLQTFALLNAPIRPQVVYEFLLNPLQRLRLHLQQHWRRYLLFSSPLLSTLITLHTRALPLPIPFPIPLVKDQFYHRFIEDRFPSTIPPFHPYNKPLLITLPCQKQLHQLLNNTKLLLPALFKRNHPLSSLVPFLFSRKKPLSITLPALTSNPPVQFPHRFTSSYPNCWALRNRILPGFAPQPAFLSFSKTFLTTTQLLPLPLPLKTLLILTPQLLSLYYHVTSPLPPQQLLDNYHNSLHPDQFHLHWTLTTISVSSPTPFLPFDLPHQPPPSLSTQPPPTPRFQSPPPIPTTLSAEIPPPPNPPPTHPDSNFLPSTSTPDLPPPRTSPPIVVDPSHVAHHPYHHLTSRSLYSILDDPAYETCVRSGFVSINQSPYLPTSLFARASTSTPTPPQFNVPPSLSHLPVYSPPDPPSTQIPPTQSTLPTGALTFTPASVPLSHPPISPPTPLSLSTQPFFTDPTCTGPVTTFELLYPAAYHPDTATFQTRLRCLPPTPLPIPKNKCLLTAFSSQTHYSEESIWHTLQTLLPDSLLSNPEISTLGLSTDILTTLCYYYHLQAVVLCPNRELHFGITTSSQTITLSYEPGPPRHFSSRPRLLGSAPHSNPDSSPLVRHALRFKHNQHYLPFTSSHTHTSSLPHAKNLISNMKNGFDGVTSTLTQPHPNGPSLRDKLFTLDSLIDHSSAKSIPVIHISGFAGCGKTHPIQHLLKTRPFLHNLRLSTPTNELRSEWKRDMRPTPENIWRFSTWESLLFKHSEILVIDECYKCPRYHHLHSILADPTLQTVILLGDPLQGEYHSNNPHSTNHPLPSEVLRFASYIDCYCWWTYRLPIKTANLFHIPTFSKQPGVITTSHTHPNQSKNLVNSIPTATAMNQMGHHAITISSSQGGTYDEINTILLDRNTNLLSPNNCLVALTRSKKGFMFVGNLHLASSDFGTNYMFSQALAQRPIDLTSTFPIDLPYLPLLHDPISSRNTRLVAGLTNFNHQPKAFKPGRNTLPPHIPLSLIIDHLYTTPSRWVTLSIHAWKPTHLPPTRLPLHTDLLPTLPSDPTPSPPPKEFATPISHAYHGEYFDSLAAFFLPAHDPTVKEIALKDQTSNQFPFLDREFSLSCQPSSLIAAIHSPSQDPTLLPASIHKRLRFRLSDAPYRITAQDNILGHHLFNSLCRAYHRSPLTVDPFDPHLFAQCISINEYSQLSSKTKATIVANASRSDPDWRFTSVRIFAKAQHKVNDGSIFGSWKACQTLALMHDYIILTLGPVKKYQRIFDMKDRPPHLYLHCGHTPCQLSAWCTEHFRPTICTTNDYTAFDQSQHGEAVVWKCLKMQRLSIPQHLINLHLHLKTNVHTQFGPLTCMRLTGEPGTYDDNSDYNIAVIYSQYTMQNLPLLVSGDDSVIVGTPPISPNWPAIKDLLHLKFKTEITSSPLFCGYYLSPAGCIRNPLAHFAKLMTCVDDMSLPEKVLSYLSEVSIGHNLGDQIIQHLPPHLIQYQSACFDFFCRNSTPSQKLLLSNDPIPESKLLALVHKIKWASKAFFSEPPQAREFLVSKSSLPSFPNNPKVSELESELLHFSQ